MYKITILILFLFTTILNAEWEINYKEPQETSFDLNKFNLTTQKENIKENINIDINENLYINISINKIKTKERAKKIIEILKEFFYDDNYSLKEIIYSEQSTKQNKINEKVSKKIVKNKKIIKKNMILKNDKNCYEKFKKQEINIKKLNEKISELENKINTNYKIIIEFDNNKNVLKSFETTGFRSLELQYEIEEFKGIE